MTTKRRGTEAVAVVAGSTGLVGRALLSRLAADPRCAAVHALARQALPLADSKLVRVPAAFDRLDEVLRGAARPDAPLHVYCALGTTIRAAGSRAAFRAVDHGLVLQLGRWARDAGADRFVLVSAVGADPTSATFYNRVKGEAERDLRALGLRGLVILRPSLLDGPRAERRPLEQLSLALARPVARWLPPGVRPVHVDDVAAAMVEAANAAAPPAVVGSAQIQGAARRR